MKPEYSQMLSTRKCLIRQICPATETHEILAGKYL